MSEKSLYWFTDGFTGSVGDGAAPYTQEEQRLYDHALLAANEADGGVWSEILNELAVSGVASPLAVATGRASVYGFPYWNDASLNLAVTTPGVGDTGGRVVLRANWTTQTVRALVVLNTDGNASIPALTQVANTTWDVPLATFVIDTSGDIWTDSSKTVAGVTDARVFAISPLAGMVKLREFVGDGTSGRCRFANIQQNLTGLLIIGTARSTDAALFDPVEMLFNADSGNNYAYNRISASAGTLSNLPATSGTSIECGSVTGDTGVANACDPLRIEIPNYTSSTFKSCQIRSSLRGNGTNGASGLTTAINDGWWDDTDSINQIDLILGTGNFAPGTIITLYGLR